MSDSREQFEAWYLAEQINEPAFLNSLPDGSYLFNAITGLWITWQASRQAVVIELPPEDKNEKLYGCYEGGWNDMRREAVEAIEAAGVRIKT